MILFFHSTFNNTLMKHAHTHARAHTHTLTHAHTHIHAHTHARAHTHTHTHTQVQSCFRDYTAVVVFAKFAWVIFCYVTSVKIKPMNKIICLIYNFYHYYTSFSGKREQL